MSLKPHPKRSVCCEARLAVTVIPWVDGRRRPGGAHQRTYFCDMWRGHEAAGSPHRCRETSEAWFRRQGDADWWPQERR